LLLLRRLLLRLLRLLLRLLLLQYSIWALGSGRVPPFAWCQSTRPAPEHPRTQTRVIAQSSSIPERMGRG
jgi:hypothetical protein